VLAHFAGAGRQTLPHGASPKYPSAVENRVDRDELTIKH
jgi:hypothetical protein